MESRNSTRHGAGETSWSVASRVTGERGGGQEEGEEEEEEEESR
jgi:hypothetical protein